MARVSTVLPALAFDIRKYFLGALTLSLMKPTISRL